MIPMGDYFDKKDEEKEEEEEKEEKIKYKNIDDIKRERYKIFHEVAIRSKDYRERIGRLDLHLFGDPSNPDVWKCKLEVLRKEIDLPMTRTHPIADKAREFIKMVEDIKNEYREFNELYKRWVGDIGHLLDSSLIIYDNEKEEKDEIIKKLNKNVKDLEEKEKIKEDMRQEEIEVDKNITEDRVREFMEKEGQEQITKYLGSEDEGDKMTAKSLFMSKGKDFFTPFHSDPESVAQRLFNIFSSKGASN